MRDVELRVAPAFDWPLSRGPHLYHRQRLVGSTQQMGATMETDYQELERFIDYCLGIRSGFADVGWNGEFSDLGECAVVDSRSEVPLIPTAFAELLSAIEDGLNYADESDDATLARALAKWLKRESSAVGLTIDVDFGLERPRSRLDKYAALAIQLGMAYQRVLLEPAERASMYGTKHQRRLAENRGKRKPAKTFEEIEDTVIRIQAASTSSMSKAQETAAEELGIDISTLKRIRRNKAKELGMETRDLRKWYAAEKEKKK